MRFQYDENGGSFYYFLLSFYVLILVPFTIFVCGLKSNKEKGQKNQNICHCYRCRMKRHYLKSNNPWKYRKHKLLKVALFVAWILFVVLLYKVSQVEMEWVEFDPFKELGVDRSASLTDVKKAYRGLTMQHHPDRGGDPKRFMRIAKAYAALTNEDARKKWEEFGNPEGPGATEFGIALPKWIIEKKNSIWVNNLNTNLLNQPNLKNATEKFKQLSGNRVNSALPHCEVDLHLVHHKVLGIYTFVFMILLPVGVGTWWYRSIKYGGEEVLLTTIRLYYFVFRSSPNVILQRGLTILCGSLEFEKSNNPEIQERPSDNFELPQLIKQLPNFNIKSKEKPFCYPYSVKARLLVHAHLNRMELPPNTLELDRRYIIKKCPYLINQMINMISYIVCIGSNGQHHVPHLETMENVMRLSPMIVQALWDKQSALLQLPHITEDMLRHFVTRKRNIKTVRQLVEMPEDERQALLRTLSYEQYRDVMIVACGMPSVQMILDTAVIDDDDQTITAGSYVTVTVRLVRQNMAVFRQNSGTNASAALTGSSSPDTFPLCPTSSTQPSTWDGDGEQEEEETGNKLPNGTSVTAAEDEKNGSAQTNATASTPKRSRPWQKNRNQKKKSTGGGGARQAHKKKVQQQQQAAKTASATAAAKEEKKEDEEEEDRQNFSFDEGISGSEDSDQGTTRAVASEKRRHKRHVDTEAKEERDSDNEEGWQRFQADVRKENSLETKEPTKHVVHCPFFPAEKLEYWWIYIADKKTRTLITTPQQIRSLQDKEEIQLKFPAPMIPGQYVFTVCLRSDSYLQLDVFQNIKLDVLEARVVEDHPQWDISSDDEEDMCRQASGSDHDDDYSDDSNYDYSD